ncbi:uncharacterized protein A1O9_11177 [Exophiala aquamarina CBS 119918]|uniref:Aldehyde dehydrogenase domain-containing protein n=1 Tax=Exophiala aquamarina CBS 119918 TaxID=1182545 RepID=A0A072PB37_9EURO|nr:uncharacterized protein A1O9_11177 [Exophiala aquamarina CBS 119918]KEF52760.1 hypothetical protein A1O9_11177 [Exophiala aquamarina CBS 119918]
MKIKTTSILPFKLVNDLSHHDSYVHGKWVQARSGRLFAVVDPFSGKERASCPDNTVKGVEAAVAFSYNAFQQYSTSITPRTRARLLMKWYDVCLSAREDLATLLTYEIGKPLAEAKEGIDCSLGFLWRCFGEAERIKGTRVGEIVASLCARNLKKCTLKLGGNCPFIIFDERRLGPGDRAIYGAKVEASRTGVYHREPPIGASGRPRSILGPAQGEKGQTAHRPWRGQGNHHGTCDNTTSPGKIAITDGRGAIAWATLVLGTGKATTGPELNNGYVMSSTILANMKADMVMAREEAFAPVCGLFKFDIEEEVVALANDTSMGLVSYAFTKNADRLWRMLDSLDAGMIGLNTENSNAAESPFGGIKAGGYCKESGTDVAVNEYLISKTGTLTLSGHY